MTDPIQKAIDALNHCLGDLTGGMDGVWQGEGAERARDAIEALKSLQGKQGEAQEALDRLMMQCQGWQPIETAPRDGTTVSLYAKDNHGEQHWIPKSQYTTMTDFIGNEYKGWTNLRRDFLEKKPTHWMPLPTPPKGKDDE